MKRIIIVAMDFSEGAINALNFAVMVANAIQANIMMVWVDKSKQASTVYSNASDPRLEVKKRFESLIEEYSERFTGGKFLYKMRYGKVFTEITNQAKYHDADLIIAGTHGASGFDEFWMGSNAYKIVAHAVCPVLTLRAFDGNDRVIKKILLPIDSTRETRQKILFTSYLARHFDAELVILSVFSSKVDTIISLVEGYVKQAAKYCEDNDIKYSVDSFDAENITNSTIKYAKENDIDLISIMTDQESSPMNLFLGPYAQQMVNHSPIPVLSIRSKNIYDYKMK
ncbi:MAG: hypothetical protein DRI86_08360 [Bacteroidetes bacterium]|nr:MAG: hypothetical protein DRI86_08360 [Bacteroidota bacterium]